MSGSALVGYGRVDRALQTAASIRQFFRFFRDENNYKFKFVIENFEKSTYVTRQVFTMQRAKYGVLDSSGER